MRNLFRYLLARNALFTVVCILLLGGFEYLLCAILATVDIAAGLKTILASVPPLFRSMVGDQLANAANLKVFGWNHPIAQSVGAALSIVLGARAVAGEIEHGAIELVMTQPISRTTYYLAHVAHAAVALLLVSLGGIAGSFIGQNVYDIEKFATPALLLVGLNYFLLQFAWFAVTLAISTFARESGRVASAAFVIALIAFIVRTIGDLWTRTAWALPYSLYNYFSPKEILLDRTTSARDFIVLAAVSLVGLTVGGVGFQRRDLP